MHPNCVHAKEQHGDQDVCGLSAQDVHKERLLPSAQSRWTRIEACTQAGVLQDWPQNAQWQFSMSKKSTNKTVFCPGLDCGLWKFTVMHYGLNKATQTCQRGLDNILKHCKDCVDNYNDNCIVFSDNMESHISDLQRVLSSLQAAGFTLRDSKCFFSRDTITHLGFQYFHAGVTPTEKCSHTVADWPTPNHQEGQVVFGPC